MAERSITLDDEEFPSLTEEEFAANLPEHLDNLEYILIKRSKEKEDVMFVKVPIDVISLSHVMWVSEDDAEDDVEHNL